MVYSYYLSGHHTSVCCCLLARNRLHLADKVNPYSKMPWRAELFEEVVLPIILY